MHGARRSLRLYWLVFRLEENSDSIVAEEVDEEVALFGNNLRLFYDNG
jgi:hypothetical protein